MGDTHVALYAIIKDSNGIILSIFRWNNFGFNVDEVNTYSLANDPVYPNVIDFDVSSWATIEVSAFANDDTDWPTPENYENDLGRVSITIDPRVASTMGSLTLGPTRTDNGNAGYLVNLEASLVQNPSQGEVRMQLENLILYDNEEWGDNHMAIYVHAGAGGEVFRWNNADNTVNEINSYQLNNGADSTTIRLYALGPTTIWVEGYTHDDEIWPSGRTHENFLGNAVIVVDPADQMTLGHRQLGPTRTDNDNTGYAINLTLDVLPRSIATPNLSITGLEVTQAIQHFSSALGSDNSVPLVANKMTLVRAYVDSGLSPSVNNGLVPGVTGTLSITGSSNLTLNPISTITAQPASMVNRQNLADTLNFFIPSNVVNGSLNLTVQASSGSSVSTPRNLSVQFVNTNRLDILMVRVQTGSIAAPSRTAYFNAVNQLPLIYPIPTNLGQALAYWYIPGSEVVTNTHNLSTDDGMSDLLDDIEDIQEESGSDWIKAYGLVPNFTMRTFGMARNWDNVSIGYSFIMESVGHELGHLYELDHAPCGGPDGTDDDFVPSNGSIGEVGVDVAGRVAFSPGVSDFMSYCGDGGTTPYENQWISAYHWNKLLDLFRVRT